jgi:antitoxin HicB
MNPMPKYGFNVFWSDEDQAFIATCPDFPGVSAFGDTEERALAEARIALRLAIETYQDEGWPLPEPKAQPTYSGQFRVRIPKTLHAQLVEQADTEGVSLNTLVVTYLSEAVGAQKVSVPLGSRQG